MGPQLDYKALFSIIPTPLVAIDDCLRIVAVNNAFMKACGIRETESIGRNVFEVFPANPNDKDATSVSDLKLSLQKVLQNGVTDEMPITKYDIPKRDSASGEFEERFWKPVNTPLFDSQGKVTHILHRVEDVTEFVQAQNRNLKMELGQNEIAALRISQEALRASQFELQKVVELTPVPMTVLKGPEHRHVITNPAHNRMVAKHVQGLTIREAFSEEERKSVETIMDRIYDTGEPFFGKELPYTFIGEDGISRERWINLSFNAIPAMDGSISGILGVAQEVSDQVTARKQLQEAMELRQAKEAAERANHLKSAFLANMSHEIRTPLGAVIGFAELLKEEDEISENDRQLYLDTIIRNGKALVGIIDDILDLAKVESGKLSMEETPFDLKELLADVLDLFREKVREKGLGLRLNVLENIPSGLLSDPSRLRQILINLIGNAIKFTQKGGIEVKVEAQESTESTVQVEIQVIDTGVGISAESMDQLFQPFSQADNTHTRKYGGTGLGLALSRRLASALNGKVEIKESHVGRGSTFVFRFQAKLDEKVKASLSMSIAKDEARLVFDGRRLLVVDDIDDNTLLAKRILSKHGAMVTTASNGAEAMEFASREDFDLILLDIQMPYMDGYEALRMLRSEGFKRPIVALTAHAMSHEIQQTLDAGFNANITKPLDQKVLIGTLEVLLLNREFQSNASSPFSCDSELPR